MDFAQLTSLIDDRPQEGIFRVDRRAFEDPAIFDLEMEHLFENGWVFLAHESQVPRVHDYLTTWLGRAPVVVMRDAQGQLNCFINSCTHKRAALVHGHAGNARVHTCHYHGWAFDSSGRNKLVKGRDAGAYPAAFDQEQVDLVRIARFANYRGMLFGSLAPHGMSLEEHLGDAKVFLDLVIDQSPGGIEFVPGVVRFTFEANWKFQLENCTDGYHFTSTHPSFLRVSEQRARSARDASHVKTVWHNNKPWESPVATQGTMSFANGHALLWAPQVNVDTHPLAAQLPGLEERVGKVRARWMLNTRNFSLFPNLQIAENAASQVRIMRPLSPTRTEMTTYCFGPVGEAAQARAQRLRQYEDFFNPSGLATPDDTRIYEDCQKGYAAPRTPWQLGYLRGATAASGEPSTHARELGIRPLSAADGSFDMYDETLMHTTYRAWHARLLQGARTEAP